MRACRRAACSRAACRRTARSRAACRRAARSLHDNHNDKLDNNYKFDHNDKFDNNELHNIDKLDAGSFQHNFKRRCSSYFRSNNSRNSRQEVQHRNHHPDRCTRRRSRGSMPCDSQEKEEIRHTEDKMRAPFTGSSFLPFCLPRCSFYAKIRVLNCKMQFRRRKMKYRLYLLLSRGCS